MALLLMPISIFVSQVDFNLPVQQLNLLEFRASVVNKATS